MPSYNGKDNERGEPKCCVGEPIPQEEFTLSFVLDESNNGRVIRIKVGANRLTSVIEQLSKRYLVTIE